MSLKFIFLVQGEGRGHLTQAIALSSYLQEAGHTISKVLVGCSPQRQVPAYFYKEIKAPTEDLTSPNFLRDRYNKGLRIGGTLLYNAVRAGRYFKSLRQIHKTITEEQPDVIVNFYEPLCGLYYKMYKCNIRHYCVSHHFFLEHHHFSLPEGRFFERQALKLTNRITSTGSWRKLALSFSEHSPDQDKHITVLPPLLRKRLFDLPPPRDKGFLLVYLLNTGHARQIIKWHKDHPDTKIHVFWDKKMKQPVYNLQHNLTFHQLDEAKFLTYLNDCSGYMTTAGFESVCEAMYLKKPIFLVPTPRHYEQRCNALDAVQHQAGISGAFFDISRFLRYIPTHNPLTYDFRAWVKQGPSRLAHLLTGQRVIKR